MVHRSGGQVKPVTRLAKPLTRLARPMTRLVRSVTLVICLGWMVSLSLPAVQLGDGAPLTGWTLLVNGWRVARAGVWAWFANPLFICSAALILARRDRAAGILAAVALMLGFSSLGAGALAARSGYEIPVLAFGSGFHLWLICLNTLCLWAWVAAFLTKMQRNSS